MNGCYEVFITALTPAYERDIVHKLLDQGYALGALNGGNLTLARERTAGVVIALYISKLGSTAQSIYDDVLAVLNAIKAKFYSLIIVPYSSEGVWNHGNFEIGVIDHLKHFN